MEIEIQYITSARYAQVVNLENIAVTEANWFGSVEVNTIVIFTPLLQGKNSVPHALNFLFVHVHVLREIKEGKRGYHSWRE